jgi:hypothetical protein
MRSIYWTLPILFAVRCAAQVPKPPDLDAQRIAMKKLDFLVGKWAGEAQIFAPTDQSIVLAQTEEAQYKLGGLILMIEGIGRAKADGKLVLQALGVISYDDETRKYRMRAFNDGRFLETEVKLLDAGQGITWGFAAGAIRTSSVMRISGKGEWTELTEITIGSQPPRKYIELTVSAQR